MTLKQNNAEGGSNGTPPSIANTGGVSGTAFSGVTIDASCSCVFSNTHAAHGSLSYACSGAPSGAIKLKYFGFTGLDFVARFYLYLTSAPTAVTSILDFLNSTSVIATVYFTAAGQLKISATSVEIPGGGYTLSTGQWYRIEIQGTVGTTTSNGVVNMDIYSLDSDVSLHNWYGTTANLGVANFYQTNFGRNTLGSAYTGTYWIDDIAVADGTTTPIGPAYAPPVAYFTWVTLGTDVTVSGTGSTTTPPATIVDYNWDWGDTTTHGSGGTVTHTYDSASTYTITLTITDSSAANDSISHDVTLTPPTTSGLPTSLSDTTGLTSNSGTVLFATTDLSGSNPVLTTFASGPTSAKYEGTVPPLIPPAEGKPLVAVVFCDRLVGTSSGTLTGKIYEGAELRSTTTAAIPAMADSGGSGNQNSGTIGGSVLLAWPWSDMQNVVDWNILTFKFSIATA